MITKLTLNLGLRWDPWMPPIDDNDTLVGFNVQQPELPVHDRPGRAQGTDVCWRSRIPSRRYI